MPRSGLLLSSSHRSLLSPKLLIDSSNAAVWLEQNSPQNDIRNREVNDQSRDINQSGEEGSRRARGIESAAAEQERQHRSRVHRMRVYILLRSGEMAIPTQVPPKSHSRPSR